MTAPDFAALAAAARTAAAQARVDADSITVTRVPGDPWADLYASARRDLHEMTAETHDRWADIYEGAAADERLHRPAHRVFADHGVGYGSTG